MKRRPLGGAGADRIDSASNGEPEATRSAPDPQVLRCAGCGAAGHAPTIVYDKAKAPPGVVLRPVFAWNDRTVLLCSACRAAWKLNRAAGRRAGR